MIKLMIWFITAVFLLLGMPWLTVTFASMNGMALCFILFFAVNPLFSTFSGILAGSDVKKLWILPIVTAGLFILGVWMFFDMGEPAFLLYGSAYLVIGIIAMLIRRFIKKKKMKNSDLRRNTYGAF